MGGLDRRLYAGEMTGFHERPDRGAGFGVETACVGQIHVRRLAHCFAAIGEWQGNARQCTDPERGFSRLAVMRHIGKTSQVSESERFECIDAARSRQAVYVDVKTVIVGNDRVTPDDVIGFHVLH